MSQLDPHFRDAVQEAAFIASELGSRLKQGREEHSYAIPTEWADLKARLAALIRQPSQLALLPVSAREELRQLVDLTRRAEEKLRRHDFPGEFHQLFPDFFTRGYGLYEAMKGIATREQDPLSWPLELDQKKANEDGGDHDDRDQVGLGTAEAARISSLSEIGRPVPEGRHMIESFWSTPINRSLVLLRNFLDPRRAQRNQGETETDFREAAERAISFTVGKGIDAGPLRDLMQASSLPDRGSAKSEAALAVVNAISDHLDNHPDTKLYFVAFHALLHVKLLFTFARPSTSQLGFGEDERRQKAEEEYRSFFSRWECLTTSAQRGELEDLETWTVLQSIAQMVRRIHTPKMPWATVWIRLRAELLAQKPPPDFDVLITELLENLARLRGEVEAVPVTSVPGGGEEAAESQDLSPVEIVIRDFLLSLKLEKKRADGKAILAELKRKGHRLTASTLRRHILPRLVALCGVKNDRDKRGYYIP